MARLDRRSLYGLLFASAVVGGCSCHHTPGVTEDEGTLTPKPAALNFGNVPLNQSQSLRLTLSNTGSDSLTISSQSITGADASSFTAQTFKTLYATGASNNGVVTFTPTTAGALTANLVFANDGSDNPLTVTLTGTGVDIDVSCTPSALNFNDVQVGVTSPVQTVTCTNNGQSTVTISASSANTDPQFAVSDSSGPSVGETVTLAAGASYAVNVTFTPTSATSASSSFTYTTCNATLCTGALPVTLNGVGVSGALSLVPSPVAFNGVAAGSSATQTITATNVGTNSLIVTCVAFDSLANGTANSNCGTADSAGTFSFSGLPSQTVTLDAGGSFTFTLDYKASGGTSDGDKIDVSYQSTGATTLSLATDVITGNQTVAPCALTIVPSTINYGTVTVNKAVVKSAKLTNNGSSTCNITGVALATGTDPSYTLDSSTPTSFNILAGASANITVDFDLLNSNTPNVRKGTVDFQSNDQNHANGQIPLIAYLSTDNPYANGWPKWHYDNNNSGHTVADTSQNNGTVIWSKSGVLESAAAAGNVFTGEPGTSYINSPVVGDNADGTYTIYQLSLNGTLYAFDQNGNVLWNTVLSPVGDSHPGTPIVTKGGDIYAVSGCDAFTSTGGEPNNLFYLNASGQILSQQQYGEDGFDACPSIAPDGTFFEADDDGEIPVSDSADPYSVMSFTANSAGQVTLSSGVALPLTQEAERFGLGVGDDGSSYWGNNGQFFAVTPPPMKLVSGWPAAGVTQPGAGDQASQGNTVTSDLAIDSTVTNSVFAYSAWLAGTTVTSVVQSLDLNTGAQNWIYNLPANGSISFNQSILASAFGNSAPAYDVSNNQLYVGNGDGLYALNMQTGALIWHFASADVTSSPAIGGDSAIFFGCIDGSFYGVNSDGSLRYKYVVSSGQPIASSPAIADDGTVFFVSDDGTLYAIR